MTEKQKVMAVVWVALVAIAFALIYRQFSFQKNTIPVDESSAVMPLSPPQAQVSVPPSGSAMPAVSVTPDSVADDILKNDADTSALDDEANGEANAAKENVQTIDDITNTYDEKQL